MARGAGLSCASPAILDWKLGTASGRVTVKEREEWRLLVPSSADRERWTTARLVFQLELQLNRRAALRISANQPARPL